MRTIPLSPGHAAPRFNVTLGSVNIRIRLRWLTRHGYYSADIYWGNGETITLGRGLHAGADLLAGLNAGLGRLVLEGETPTVDSLGVTSNLRWYPDE